MADVDQGKGTHGYVFHYDLYVPDFIQQFQTVRPEQGADGRRSDEADTDACPEYLRNFLRENGIRRRRSGEGGFILRYRSSDCIGTVVLYKE